MPQEVGGPWCAQGRAPSRLLLRRRIPHRRPSRALTLDPMAGGSRSPSLTTGRKRRVRCRPVMDTGGPKAAWLPGWPLVLTCHLWRAAVGPCPHVPWPPICLRWSDCSGWPQPASASVGLLLRVYGGLLWAYLLTLAQSPPPQAIVGRSTLGSLESLPWGLELWGAASYMMLACGPWTQDRLSPQRGRGRGSACRCCTVSRSSLLPHCLHSRGHTATHTDGGRNLCAAASGKPPSLLLLPPGPPSVSPGRSWCLKGSICVCTEDRALAQGWLVRMEVQPF